jgi:proteasome lid subunit RPN8/RPN11
VVIHLSQSQYQQICQALVMVYPQEGCGLIVGRRVFDGSKAAQGVEDTYREAISVIPVENTWDESQVEVTDQADTLENNHGRHDRYWIDPVILLHTQRTAREQGLEIIGIYHSHPDHPAVPSECDRRLAWPLYSYLIASVSQGQVVDLQSWRLDQAEQFQPEPVKIFGSSASKPSFLS